MHHHLSGELVDGEWTYLKPHRPHITVPSSPDMPTFSVKNKDRALGSMDSGPLGLERRHGHDAGNLGSKCSDSSPSATTHDSSPSISQLSHFQHHSSSLPSRRRTSFLSAASDALGLRKKIGSVSRKKPNFHSVPHTTNIMQGVIEINARNNIVGTSTVDGSASHRDHEHEEREWLRDVAAQSIGLDPELLHHSRRSTSRLSLDSPQGPPQPTRIPPFPATQNALRPFTELSATLPKFVQPSSLLIYALAKQWKPRTIVLTSHPVSQKTHVHLFKSVSKDEREVERLEVTEESVIFVAEEEVGGRGHVIKFAGKDVSTKRSGSTREDSSHTMWFLQITDPAESQRWIAAIKNAVLAQRAARAGLDVPERMGGGSEPKGDMDVMLSMRLQGIIPAHPSKPPPSPAPTSSSPPPSLRSLRISAPSLPSPPTAMKGIFSGTRPRSPSVEGSSPLVYPSGHAEDSFGAAGASLLTMLRTKSSTDSGSSPSQPLPQPLPHLPGPGSPVPSLRSNNVITASDLKISRERDTPGTSIVVPEARSSSTPPGPIIPPLPPISRQGTSTLSLQPPPRKGKPVVTTIPATFLHEPRGMYKQAGGNRSVARNFGIPLRDADNLTPTGTSFAPMDSPGLSSERGSLPRDSGLDVSSHGIGAAHGSEWSEEVALGQLENGSVNSSYPGSSSVSADRLVQSTVVTKRWSRQGVPLPKQLIPPSGPPPSIPSSPEKNHRTSAESSVSLPITYTADRSPSSSSSNSHSQVRISPRSGSSLSPTFWKRASGSSTYSVSSTNTSDSRVRSERLVLLGGISSPSSLGLVVGNGPSSRPMSMSIVGSSPAAHIGAAKRRSMPPPRPAPNFAPPPAPIVQESASEPPHALAPQKSLRSTVAQRAMRLSLSSPKPPPSSALPPRPDEAAPTQGHRRSSSASLSDLHLVPASPSCSTSTLSGDSNPVQPASPPVRSLSLRRRLRILSVPSNSCSPVQSPPPLMPSTQVSTLDLIDDNDDGLPTPHFRSSQPFVLGEHIMTLQNGSSFLQLENPTTPTTPKPLPYNLHQPMSPSLSKMNDLRIPSLEPDRDFVALSPPPRRRDSKPHIATAARSETAETQSSGSVERESNLALSRHGSMVSLGFVTT